MSEHFNQIRHQVAAKAPRVMAQMAHFHVSKDDLELSGAALEAACKQFCFVECVTPPPLHPGTSGKLAVEFKLEIGHGNVCHLWMDDEGTLTDDPDKARCVDSNWKDFKSSGDELRELAYDGVKRAKVLARKIGVPEGLRIYDNLP